MKSLGTKVLPLVTLVAGFFLSSWTTTTANFQLAPVNGSNR